MAKRTPHDIGVVILESGKWGLIGGFMERDETIREAVAREAFEETGWKIENITLLMIRDDPSSAVEDRQNIKFVFFADAVEKTGGQDNESTAIEWFPLDTIPPAEQIAFDHFDSIETYRRWKKEQFPLPVF